MFQDGGFEWADAIMMTVGLSSYEHFVFHLDSSLSMSIQKRIAKVFEFLGYQHFYFFLGR